MKFCDNWALSFVAKQLNDNNFKFWGSLMIVGGLVVDKFWNFVTFVAKQLNDNNFKFWGSLMIVINVFEQLNHNNDKGSVWAVS